MLLVVLATFGAGFLNSVAGGGSLISFPALVASGLSPLAANVTNTLALWPGYVGGALAHRRQLGGNGHLPRYLVAGGVGAVGGAAALLGLDSGVFDAIVPFLVLLAAGLLAVPDAWIVRLRTRRRGAGSLVADPVAAPGRAGHGAPAGGGADRDTDGAGAEGAEGAGRSGASRSARPGWATLLAVALGGAYGAYFGGALGVVLLAVLTAAVGYDLPRANAVKNSLSLLVNTVALVAFVGLAAPVDWASVAVGAPASLAGALTGGVASARLAPTWLRRGIVAYALVAGVLLLVT
jgi:uncharacterized membrane protein YfcA